MEINKEEVFECLQNFDDRVSEQDKIPEPLESYLKYVASTGDVLYPWPNIKPLIRRKVERVLDEFHQDHDHDVPASVSPPFNYEELKKDIMACIDSFSGAPFTIQRICELLTLPTKHYKRTDKFMRGLEKNVLVVSHIEHKIPAAERPPTPPRSIFAPDPPFHLFERSLNTLEGNGILSSGPSTSTSSSPGPSTSSIQDSLGHVNHTNSYLEPVPSTSSSSPPRGNVFLEMNRTSPQASSSHTKMTGSPILMNLDMAVAPAPLQQLDSFTTVFSSSPSSTPLDVVSNMAPFEAASSSSSSSSSEESSAESSPQPDVVNDSSSPEPAANESHINGDVPHDIIPEVIQQEAYEENVAVSETVTPSTLAVTDGDSFVEIDKTVEMVTH